MTLHPITWLILCADAGWNNWPNSPYWPLRPICKSFHFLVTSWITTQYKHKVNLFQKNLNLYQEVPCIWGPSKQDWVHPLSEYLSRRSRSEETFVSNVLHVCRTRPERKRERQTDRVGHHRRTWSKVRLSSLMDSLASFTYHTAKLGPRQGVLVGN